MARPLDGETDEALFILCRTTADPGVIRAAVGVLAERHHAFLVRYLVRFVGTVEAAEDVAQEAFIRIARHAREYREVARVVTWLTRIATNLALNAVRDRKRRPALSLQAPIGDGEDGAARGDGVPDRREPDPAARAEVRETAARVRAAIDGLPEASRAVVLLCDLEGWSYEAAADALGVPVGTIRSRLFRARERLQAVLGPAVVRGDL